MIYLVYPFDENKIASPWCIGNHLAKELRARGHEVKQYDWESEGQIWPKPLDILIGHPALVKGKIFEANCPNDIFRRRIVLAPPYLPETALEIWSKCLDKADKFLAIAGPHWDEELRNTFGPKLQRIDMAIDGEEFPRIKDRPSPIGHRRVLYIGCTVPVKGIDVLEQLATRFYWIRFAHIGPGTIRNVENIGYLDLKTEYAKSIIKDYDIVISTSKRDCNPTSILEGICLGLIPLCTAESGWGSDITATFPVENLAEAEKMLRHYIFLDDKAMVEESQKRRATVVEKYNWANFTNKIMEAIQ